MASYGVKQLLYGIKSPVSDTLNSAQVAQAKPLTRQYTSQGVVGPQNAGLTSAEINPYGGTTPPRPEPASTPGPAPAPPATNPNQGGGNTPLSYDPADPVLASIKAFNDRSVAEAESQSLAAKKQALVRGGFADLARSLLGDEQTAQAAAENPFSTLAQLLTTHKGRVQNIDTGRNKQNLYYSSTRANDLGNEAQQYLGDQAGAQQSLYDLLANADSAVSQTKNAAADRYQSALPDAIARWLAGHQGTGATVDPRSNDGPGAASPTPEVYYVIGPGGKITPQLGRPAHGLAMV
jgi:hypothetical protein